MRSLQSVIFAALLVGLAIAFACGGSGTEDTITPTGGESCLADRKICISVPPKGLADSVTLRINAGTDAPAAALSESFDISATNGKPVKFLIPATVTIKLDIVDANDVPSDNLLRIYTRDPDTNDWVALDSPIIDHVRGEVTGQTTHLSPFVVLRADRLPDGSLPDEIDGGSRDGGKVVLPPIPDAGKPPNPKPDAGQPPVVDAGRPPVVDAGQPPVVDAGQPPVVDAGQPPVVDAGQPVVDAGQPPVDAGQPAVDAGGPVDSGQPAFDAGFDAGGAEPDAGCDGGTC